MTVDENHEAAVHCDVVLDFGSAVRVGGQGQVDTGVDTCGEVDNGEVARSTFTSEACFERGIGDSLTTGDGNVAFADQVREGLFREVALLRARYSQRPTITEKYGLTSKVCSVYNSAAGKVATQPSPARVGAGVIDSGC